MKRNHPKAPAHSSLINRNSILSVQPKLDPCLRQYSNDNLFTRLNIPHVPWERPPFELWKTTDI